MIKKLKPLSGKDKLSFGLKPFKTHLKINSQKLKLPSGKILKGDERKKFEVSKIKIDVLKSNLISELN